jgi:hypothetical protein
MSDLPPLSDLQRMWSLAKTPQDQRRVRDLIARVHWAKSQPGQGSGAPYYFLTRMALTKDEHDDQQPYKPFPEKEYLRLTAEEWWCPTWDRRLLVEKSRQIMVSWLFAALFLWKCMTHKGQRCGLQSKKEEDADKLLERAFGVWERLPAVVREMVPCERKYAQLRFPSTDSTMHGLAQGSDQARSMTFSEYLIDEGAFQDSLATTLTAVLPTLGPDQGFAVVSTPKRGYMEMLAKASMVPGSYEGLLPSCWPERWKRPGMERRQTIDEWTLLSIHHSSDPEKGEAWAKDRAKKYPGGIDGAAWKQEHDLDWGARSGQLVYEDFSVENHVISLAREKVPEAWPKFLIVDPGWVHPCVALFGAVDGDGTYYIIDEIYKTRHTAKKMAPLIKAHTGKWDLQLSLIGRDAYEESQKAAGKTIAEQYADEGIYFSPVAAGPGSVKSGIQAVENALKLRGNGESGLKVLEHCVETIREFGSYRFEELDDDDLLVKKIREEPVKFNDDCMDCVRYFVTAVPPDYMKRWAMRDPYQLEEEVMTVQRSRRLRRNRASWASHAEEDEMAGLYDE